MEHYEDLKLRGRTTPHMTCGITLGTAQLPLWDRTPVLHFRDMGRHEESSFSLLWRPGGSALYL